MKVLGVLLALLFGQEETYEESILLWFVDSDFEHWVRLCGRRFMDASYSQASDNLVARRRFQLAAVDRVDWPSADFVVGRQAPESTADACPMTRFIIVKRHYKMKSNQRVLIELPCSEDIVSVEEVRCPTNTNVIKKTIRYRNGMVAVIVQDFGSAVFSIRVYSSSTPFVLSENQILRTEE